MEEQGQPLWDLRMRTRAFILVPQIIICLYLFPIEKKGLVSVSNPQIGLAFHQQKSAYGISKRVLKFV